VKPPTFDRHLLITGPGRSGTTFMVQLLTALGMDTGFNDFGEVDPRSHSGMEHNILEHNLPYVVKSPHVCDQILEALQRGIKIDRAIICMRDLNAAAASRRYIHEVYGDAPGGLWDVNHGDYQSTVLAIKTYNLLVGLARCDAKVCLMHYGWLHSVNYVIEKFWSIGLNFTYQEIREAHEKTYCAEKRHIYTSQDLPEFE
jgi:hypothetical protein